MSNVLLQHRQDGGTAYFTKLSFLPIRTVLYLSLGCLKMIYMKGVTIELGNGPLKTSLVELGHVLTKPKWN